MSRSIEDMSAGPEIEIVMVDLDLIEFDPKNPNALDDQKFDALTREIRDHGFKQPVVLWKRGEGDYRMIDGEHRARVLGDLGAERVPAVLVEGENEDDARLRLLTMNGLRGNMVPIKMAYMLKDLATRIDEGELRKRLGMEGPEFRDTLRLASFADPVEVKLKEAVEREQREAPTVLRFVCTSTDAEIIERVVDTLVEGKIDRGQALGKIARQYERSKKDDGAVE